MDQSSTYSFEEENFVKEALSCKLIALPGQAY